MNTRILVACSWLGCAVAGGLGSATGHASAAEFHEGQPGSMVTLPDLDHDGRGCRSAETTCDFVMPGDGDYEARLVLAQHAGGPPHSTVMLHGSGWSKLKIEDGTLPYAPQVFIIHLCMNPDDPTVHYAIPTGPYSIALDEVSPAYKGCPDWAPSFIQATCSTVTTW